ncbi:MAG: hypothetical protein IKP07_01815 [Bacilli bacterium]|nr:hypothetical protein [Bacilli bacterium]
MSKIKMKNSKKNNYKRQRMRLLVLILLVLVMIFMLFGSTFAWFSTNKHATIESIDINVATVTGLQVSVDALDWGNEVTKDQIINAYKTYSFAENQLPDTLTNVSTAGGITNGKMDMFYGVTSEEKSGGFTLTTIKQTEKNCVGDADCVDKHYIAFDIFLLVTTPATIAITGNSNVIPQEGAVDKGSQNAARVGFVIEGTVGAQDSYAAQILKGGLYSLIWEPNIDRHTSTGIANARNVYGLETTASGAARLAYRGVNQEFQTPVYIDQTDRSSYFTPVNPKVATVQGFTANQELMSIPAGITKVRVYMWLEGQDVDMENNASASKLSYNLELSMIN